MRRPGSRQSWFVRRMGLLSLGGALLMAAPRDARASEIAAALPQILYRGPPRGWASTEGVDWTRSHAVVEPLAPGAARVLWRELVPGGISSNLVVDAAGRVFAAGQGHVTQLDRDGAREYRHRTQVAGAVTTTLLADGARAVLTRDGHLMSWSGNGTALLDVALAVPSRWSRGSLLPLPAGEALVSVGPWLYQLDASGDPRGHARLDHVVQQTLIAGDHILVVDTEGNILTWKGHSLPEPHGSFGGRVLRVMAQTPSALLGLRSDGTLVEVSSLSGERRELMHWEHSALLPVLAAAGNDELALMRADGSALLASVTHPPAASPIAPGQVEALGTAHLLAGPDGTLAWLASNSPLRLQRGSAFQEISEVRCPHPVSLVPAGPARLAVACSSGQIWLIGQSTGAPSVPAPDSGRQPGSPRNSARQPMATAKKKPYILPNQAQRGTRVRP